MASPETGLAPPLFKVLYKSFCSDIEHIGVRNLLWSDDTEICRLATKEDMGYTY